MCTFFQNLKLKRKGVISNIRKFPSDRSNISTVVSQPAEGCNFSYFTLEANCWIEFNILKITLWVPCLLCHECLNLKCSLTDIRENKSNILKNLLVWITFNVILKVNDPVHHIIGIKVCAWLMDWCFEVERKNLFPGVTHQMVLRSLYFSRYYRGYRKEMRPSTIY